MKNKLLIIITVFTCFNIFSQSNGLSLKGKWLDKQLQVEYEFINDKDAFFSQMGYGMPISYKLDYTQSPYWIDFTLKRGGKEVKIPGLIRVINKNTIWIEQFPPFSKHPTKFSKDFISRTRKIHVLVRMKS